MMSDVLDLEAFRRDRRIAAFMPPPPRFQVGDPVHHRRDPDRAGTVTRNMGYGHGGYAYVVRTPRLVFVAGEDALVRGLPAPADDSA